MSTSAEEEHLARNPPTLTDPQVFLDWCPTKTADISQNGVFCIQAEDADLVNVIDRVYSKFGEKILYLDCAGRSDGYIMAFVCFKDNEDYRPAKVERYIMRKLKECVLNHSHVFHNTALSLRPSHDPVRVDVESINLIANQRFFLPGNWLESYINQDQSAASTNGKPKPALKDIFSNDGFLSDLTAKSVINNQKYFAIDLLYQAYIRENFNVKNEISSIFRLMIERTEHKKCIEISIIIIITLSALVFSYIADYYNYINMINFIILYAIFLFLTILIKNIISFNYLYNCRDIYEYCIKFSIIIEYYIEVHKSVIKRSSKINGINNSQIGDAQNIYLSKIVDSDIESISRKIDRTKTTTLINLTILSIIIASLSIVKLNFQ